MDFSNLDSKHSLFNKERQNLPTYFKDESSRKVIFLNCISLSPKCYSILSKSLTDGSLISSGKCKGVPNSYVEVLFCTHSSWKMPLIHFFPLLQTHFTHDVYRDCLLHTKLIQANYRAIRVKNSILTTDSLSKVCRKRKWLKNLFLIHFHFSFVWARTIPKDTGRVQKWVFFTEGSVIFRDFSGKTV